MHLWRQVSRAAADRCLQPATCVDVARPHAVVYLLPPASLFAQPRVFVFRPAHCAARPLRWSSNVAEVRHRTKGDKPGALRTLPSCKRDLPEFLHRRPRIRRAYPKTNVAHVQVGTENRLEIICVAPPLIREGLGSGCFARKPPVDTAPRRTSGHEPGLFLLAPARTRESLPEPLRCHPVEGKGHCLARRRIVHPSIFIIAHQKSSRSKQNAEGTREVRDDRYRVNLGVRRPRHDCSDPFFKLPLDREKSAGEKDLPSFLPSPFPSRGGATERWTACSAIIPKTVASSGGRTESSRK